ncbi:fibrinogen-like protein A [Ostrea edulis]|uniref:fibrinogen-like protein A n=1 Tax=Ostrea edulis TaxID=37623 RepID=UPI0024AF89C5|nr:fibrinogen-like protein A [Ostrea edulis]
MYRLYNRVAFHVLRVPLLSSIAYTVFVDNYYTEFPKFYDSLEMNCLGTYYAASLITCTGLCSGDLCQCYGYNSLTKSCRLYSECRFGNVTQSRGNWQYYTSEKNAQGHIVSKGTDTDCFDYYQRNMTTSGVYTIHPFEDNSLQVQVYCDMDTSGGGWTVIQSRHDGSVNFSRNWTEYKEGFGSVFNEHWIGNNVIHQLTKSNDTRIYFSVTLTNGSILYQEYDRFSISDESDGYRLFLSKPSTGSLGDRLVDTGSSSDNVVGMNFSTIGLHSCASGYGAGGGWWYNSCHDAYLNGPYKSTAWNQPWDPPIQSGSKVSRTKMMIRKG